MRIELLEQILHFTFSVNQQYYRVDFEIKAASSKWSVRMVDLELNETVYSTLMDTVIVPDSQLAEDMIKTYITRGLSSGHLTH